MICLAACISITEHVRDRMSLISGFKDNAGAFSKAIRVYRNYLLQLYSNISDIDANALINHFKLSEEARDLYMV